MDGIEQPSRGMYGVGRQRKRRHSTSGVETTTPNVYGVVDIGIKKARPLSEYAPPPSESSQAGITTTEVLWSQVSQKKKDKIVRAVESIAGEVQDGVRDTWRQTLVQDRYHKMRSIVAEAAQGSPEDMILTLEKVVPNPATIFTDLVPNFTRTEDGDSVLSSLHCRRCNSEIAITNHTKTKLRQHLLGATHINGLETKTAVSGLVLDAQGERGAEALIVRDFQSRWPQSTISDGSIRLREFAVRIFARRGIPLNVLNDPNFRALIEGTHPLQGEGSSLGSISHLPEVVPTALLMQVSLLKTELDPRRNLMSGFGYDNYTNVRVPHTIIYDESTLWDAHIGLTVAVWVDEIEWRIKYRVVDVKILGASQNATETRNAIESAMAKFESGLPAVIIGDGCNTQYLGMVMAALGLEEQADATYKHVLESLAQRRATDVVVCFPHTINNALKHLIGFKEKDQTLLGQFNRAWRSLMAHSTLLKSTWKAVVAKSHKNYRGQCAWHNKATSAGTKTRWFTRWEIMRDVFFWFEELVSLKSSSVWRDIADSDNALLIKRLLQDSETVATIRDQMAAAVFFGAPLVEACYTLEAEGFVGPFVAEALEKLERFGKLAAMDASMAIINLELDDYGEAVEIWLDIKGRAEGKAAPQGEDSRRHVQLAMETLLDRGRKSYAYLHAKMGIAGPDPNTNGIVDSNRKVSATMTNAVRLFKSFEALVPSEDRREPWTNDLVKLCLNLPKEAFSEMSMSAIKNNIKKDAAAMRKEISDGTLPLPDLTGGMSVSEKGRLLWAWWGRRKRKFKHLTKLVTKVALYLPTSAPVERAFTILSNRFNAQQSMMRNLTIILTLMEAFNNSQREKETLEMLGRTRTRRPN